MRVRFTLLFFVCFLAFLPRSEADLPLPFGADAPDFTLTDLNGVTHTLSDYLDAGKMVIIDFSAVWCGPCWNYHNTHILSDIYNDYGPNGTDEVMVFFIEGDPSTPASSLYGGPGSQGNWVAGTPYPIMDDPSGSVTSSYAITYFPTLYAICPNGKTYVAGQISYPQWENWIQTCSLDASSSITDALCFSGATGAIDLMPSGGLGNLSYQWSNGSNTQDISNLPPGTYTCTITEGQGHTIEAGPYTVDSPPDLVVTSSTTTDVTCFGDQTGFASVAAGGGTPGYNYQWNNGQSGPVLANVAAGNYSVVITDANGCTEVEAVTIQQPLPLVSSATVQDENCGSQDGLILLSPQGGTYPYTFDIGDGPTQSPVFPNLAAGSYDLSVIDGVGCTFDLSVDVAAIPGPVSDAGPASQVDCNALEVLLDGSGSDSGASITYQWNTVDGDIISGDDTTTPLVGAAGTYELIVTEEVSGCQSISTVVVTENFATPVADAGTDGELDCTAVDLQLDGTGSSQGASIAYSWTTMDGNIVAGEDAVDPLVDAPGTYTLEVTDQSNGCIATSTVVVTADTDLPIADAGPAGQLNCSNSSVTLDGSGSEAGSTIEYHWTTADGNIVSGDDSTTPVVDAPGTYEILVIDTENGCESTSIVMVTEDLAVPIADAGTDAVLNCNITDLVLDGTNSSAGSDITYSWTTADGNIVSDDTTMEPTVDAPGTYTLEVLNADNGCLATSTVVVVAIDPVEIQLDNQLDVLCAEDTDGEATVIAVDGTGPYSFAWSTGGTQATETGLGAGIYTVSVTDADNCTDELEVEILAPAPVAPNATATNETFADANDGTATVAPTGGTGPFSYQWDTGDTDATITGLAPGTYSVTVMDANGCTEVASVTVGEFNCSISALANAQPVSCFGGTDGSAILDLSNALEPYSIEWSSGGDDLEETGLAAGTYTVSVLDGNNCPATVSITISEPAAIAFDLVDLTLPTCFGEANGVATVAAEGGTGAISYLWPSGNEGATEEGLAAGLYTVLATDANGCTSELEVEVDQPDALAVDALIENESANEAHDASITVEPMGGTEPYTYLWNTGATTETIQDLAPGTYTVEITDGNDCVWTETYTIDPFDCGIIELTSEAEDASCFGTDDGSATVEISGGTGPYTYEWFNGSNEEVLNNLPAGTYGVTVLDANNCPVDTEVIVEEPQELNLTVAEQMDIECPGQEAGSATVEASGGTPGYQYLWEDEQTGPTATNLPAGTILVQVTDVQGCNDLLLVLIEEGEDDTAPEIIALDQIILPLDINGTADLSIGMVDEGTFDNCGEPILSLGQTSFDCADVGTMLVEFTATDDAGNSATTMIEVTVVDNMSPALNCLPDIVSTSCGEPVFFADPFYSDNCGATLEQTQGLPSGSIFPEGETTISYTATDAAGNATECSFNVIIENTLEASSLATGTCEDQSDGTITVEGSGGLPGYTFLWNTGDTEPVLEDLPGGLYTCTVTDAVGCTDILEVEVEVYPGPSYEIVEVTNDDNGTGSGAIDASVTDGTGPYTYVWTNEEGEEIGYEEDITGLSAGIYFLEFTDANGCSGVSDPVLVENVVNVKGVFAGSSWVVFPNPAQDQCQVQLELPNPAEVTLQVFDITGRVVLEMPAQSITTDHQWTLELGQLSSGLYLVRLQAGAQSITERLIIR